MAFFCRLTPAAAAAAAADPAIPAGLADPAGNWGTSKAMMVNSAFAS